MGYMMMTKYDFQVLIDVALESQRIASASYHLSDLAAAEYHKLAREIEELRKELRNAMLED